MSQLSPPLCMDNPGATRREYGLDWLRVFAFLILIGYHTGKYFAPGNWLVMNPERSELIQWIMVFVSRWRLPLVFFIAGAGVYFSLQRRSFPRFLAERFRRLFVPLIFGMLVIIPPQLYFARLFRGQAAGSYWEFWRSVFRFIPYPAGNLSWEHLWFVAYILVYSVVCIPLFALLKCPAGRTFVDALARTAERPGLLYVAGVPSLVVAVWLAPKWPVTMNLVSDWANFASSLVMFLWGFIICGSDRFLRLLERKRRELLAVSMGVCLAGYLIWLRGWQLEWNPAVRLLVRMVVETYLTMGLVLSLVGYSRARLNQGSAVLRYANTAVYPFYIVHQTITVALGYYMTGWSAPIAVKLPVLAAGTFLGSWIAVELGRRNPVSRVLMGIKS